MGRPPRVFVAVGERYGRLVVLSKTRAGKAGREVDAKCDCGPTVVVGVAPLVRGKTQSCGCLQRERTGNANRRHGMSATAPYNVWKAIVARVYNPSNASYARYGGRGIGMCERWRSSYAEFVKDVGRRPSPRHEIDRIDNDGNYEPGNVRWATRREQMTNVSNNRIVQFRGVDCRASALSHEFGVPNSTFHKRLDNGWDVERALSQPVRRR